MNLTTGTEAAMQIGAVIEHDFTARKESANYLERPGMQHAAELRKKTVRWGELNIEIEQTLEKVIAPQIMPSAEQSLSKAALGSVIPFDNKATDVVAIHEAAHFVFCKTLSLGEVLSVTIEPTIHQGERLGGCVMRKRTMMERLIDAEIDGTPQSEHFSSTHSAAEIAEHLTAYQRMKRDFAAQLILLHIAGTAAEQELAHGDGLFSKLDIMHARRLAKFIVPECDITGLLEARLLAARKLCAGPLRASILRVSEQLRRRKTLHETDVNAIWEECARASL